MVSGEFDEATPALQVPLVEGIRANGVEVEQEVMAGCSHLPFWEDPERYLALVDGWLAPARLAAVNGASRCQQPGPERVHHQLGRLLRADLRLLARTATRPPARTPR